MVKHRLIYKSIKLYLMWEGRQRGNSQPYIGQWKCAASLLVGKQRHWRLEGGGRLVSFAGVLYSIRNGMDKH